ncbi:hypothetical protein TNCV_1617261 [Trichonephila clavipes]|nr:hypothetical protein TNCV_1617261 [Trichonephila clavipes]
MKEQVGTVIMRISYWTEYGIFLSEEKHSELRISQIEAHIVHRGKGRGARLRLSIDAALRTMQGTLKVLTLAWCKVWNWDAS